MIRHRWRSQSSSPRVAAPRVRCRPTRLLAPLLLFSVAGSGVQAAAPAATAASPLLESGTLTVPGANFSIKSPADGWTWTERPAANRQALAQAHYFFCDSADQATRLSVTEVAMAEEDRFDCLMMDAIGTAKRQNYSRSGWAMSGYRYRRSASPLPGSYSMLYDVKRPESPTLHCFGRVAWTGHQVILQTCSPNAAEPAPFVTFVSSFRTLAAAPPLPTRRSPLASPEPYLLVIPLALVVAVLLNRLQWVAPLDIWRFAGYAVALALVAAIVFLTTRPIFQDLPGDEQAMQVGELLGNTFLAFLIVVIGAAVSRRRAQTRARRAAQAARDTATAP
jgi:hypothetical protein